ncbi:MAG TPA: M48 family metallopeptidase, partial [Halomonas sp.]|nr:M48 family metallopeptidase [Halomonas sp.]
IVVEIRRKAIKNLHVGVYPLDGRVRVAAPRHLDDEAMRLAIVSRLSWYRRRLKTIKARRLWLNLELVKKPPRCLEYILVHEMVHLLERHHTDRFRYLMDQFMPDWRLRRAELNETPLAHEEWGY